MPSRDFYARSTVEVAHDLLGTVLLHETNHGPLAGRIVETEAYLGSGDLAAHSAAGVTPRTRVIFGPPGHAYVYRSYGIHNCLNVVAEPEGEAGCVLIRAIEPLVGTERMAILRPKAKTVRDIASGPGKLTQAMAIGLELNATDLLDGPLTVRLPQTLVKPAIVTSRRIGITRSADLELRFLVSNNQFVSRR